MGFANYTVNPGLGGYNYYIYQVYHILKWVFHGMFLGSGLRAHHPGRMALQVSCDAVKLNTHLAQVPLASGALHRC